MQTYDLTLPIDDESIDKLRVGDIVYINGTVRTARDMAHIEIRKLLEQGKPLPENLKGGAIFHAGPVALREGDGWRLNVIGPTTSIRMEPYAEMVGELGVKMIIGKGGMADGTLAAMQKYKQVYLQAAPGCAVQIASGVKAINNVHWLENGMPEAMWVLETEKFGPFIVTMDSHGNSRYDDIRAQAQNTIDDINYR
jgi:tartrate/fumarate subfamily iron-sulfur-dependent hydro-lyase beta chain